MPDEEKYRGAERRWPHWWDKWVNPTTVLSLIGGIVWGIQLNMAVVDHSAQIGAINGRLDAHQQLLSEQAQALARSSVILEGIEIRMREYNESMNTHFRSANEIHRQVVANTTRLEAGNGDRK